jgi:hypothetical protein
MPPPLFQVPGWSVSTELSSSSSSKKSKKRKGPHDPIASSFNLESAQINLKKLMDTLDSVRLPPKKKHKGKQSNDPSEGVVNKKPVATTPPKDSVEKAKIKDVKGRPKKPTETQPKLKEKGGSKSKYPTKVPESGEPNLTALQNRMKKKLDGARFRWVVDLQYSPLSIVSHEPVKGAHSSLLCGN